ncbi:MAG: hypothetical protein ABI586_10470 [Candidatus Nanopelagicales bacterium]
MRAETADVKKALAAYPAEIAALKRRSQELERQVRRRPREAAQAADEAQGGGSSIKGRDSAKSWLRSAEG